MHFSGCTPLCFPHLFSRCRMPAYKNPPDRFPTDESRAGIPPRTASSPVFFRTYRFIWEQLPVHPYSSGYKSCGCVPLFPRDLAACLHSLIYYGGYAIPALHSEQTNFRRRQQLSFSISSACFCDFLFYLFYRKPKLCATRKKWQFKMQANACGEKVCFIISVKMLLFPHTDLKKPTFKKRTENLSQKARQYSAEFLANMAKSSTLFFCGVQKKTKKK